MIRARPKAKNGENGLKSSKKSVLTHVFAISLAFGTECMQQKEILRIFFKIGLFWPYMLFFYAVG